MSEDIYDRVLYPGHAYQRAHPDAMAVAARLFGMEPRDVQRCRVLEIGCNEGGNLIPMAFGLPGSEFVGIDLAPGAIARAEARIGRLGLTNVRVRAMDLMDAGPDLGKFDYIVAHGLYSWVPAEVREKLLAVCRAHMNPQGVAYVSYNTYPAGHLRQVGRGAMRFHAARIGAEGEESVRAGESFLKFLADSLEDANIGKAVYKDEFERQSKRHDGGVFHDEMSDFYTPFYFTEVADAAGRHGLQFLSEAKLRDMLSPKIKVDALRMLNESVGDDLIAWQQYVDFLVFRGFRETLLCHGEVALEREGLAERMAGMWMASSVWRFGEGADGAIEYRVPHGKGSIRTNHPGMITVLDRLAEIWPRGERVENLEGPLLDLVAMGLTELRVREIEVAAAVSERPVASRLARMEAEEEDAITSMLHRSIRMEDRMAREFVLLLDGTRDHAALVEAVAAAHPEVARDTVDAQVRANLLELCRSGVLVS